LLGGLEIVRVIGVGKRVMENQGTRARSTTPHDLKIGPNTTGYERKSLDLHQSPVLNPVFEKPALQAIRCWQRWDEPETSQGQGLVRPMLPEERTQSANFAKVREDPQPILFASPGRKVLAG